MLLLFVLGLIFGITCFSVSQLPHYPQRGGLTLELIFFG